MKDPYSGYSTSDNSDLNDDPPHLFELKRSKGPSKESVRKILDFSKALEVPEGRDGKKSGLELIRN